MPRVEPAYGVARLAIRRRHVSAGAAVDMDVDEPGRHPVTLDVDLLHRLRRHAVAKGGDPAVGDRDPAVRSGGRPARPGQKTCPVEHEIDCHGARLDQAPGSVRQADDAPSQASTSAATSSGDRSVLSMRR